VDQDRLGGFGLGLLAGSFDEFAVDEGRSVADQGDEVGCGTKEKERSCPGSQNKPAPSLGEFVFQVAGGFPYDVERRGDE
jgi:hypothetical protein